MREFLKLSQEDQKLAMEQTAARKGWVASSVEKDFWVCWSLVAPEQRRAPLAGSVFCHAPPIRGAQTAAGLCPSSSGCGAIKRSASPGRDHRLSAALASNVVVEPATAVRIYSRPLSSNNPPGVAPDTLLI